MELWQVRNILEASTSQDSLKLQSAEKVLRTVETTPGFYSKVQQLILTSEDVKIRSVAAILLKNSVDKFWRRTSNNALSSEEKRSIRSQLLSMLDDPSPQIARQHALTISKIARIDFPVQWPNVFSELTAKIEASIESPQILVNGFETLSRVIKALCQGRLASSRRHLQQAAPSVFRFVLNIYKYFIEVYSGTKREDALVHLSIKLSLRCIKHLMAYAIPPEQLVGEIQAFYAFSSKTTSHLFDSRFGESDAQAAIHIDQLLYYHYKVFRLHADHGGIALLVYAEYLSLIHTTISRLVDGTLSPSSEDTSDPERRLVIEMMLFSRTIIQLLYQNTSSPYDEGLHGVRSLMNVHGNMQLLSGALLHKYLPLQPADMQAWEANPEDWFLDDVNRSFEVDVQQSAEKLLVDLLNYDGSAVISVVEQSLQALDHGDERAMALQKDAAYHALGIVIDSDHRSTVENLYIRILEVEDSHPSSSAISRRRIAWLIGRCSEIQLSPNLQTISYASLVRYFSRDDDVVVKLTAARCLQTIIDSLYFSADVFEPHILECVQSAAGILNDYLSEMESMKLILDLLRSMIEILGYRMSPYIDNLVSRVQDFWHEASENPTFKISTLALMTQITSSIPDLPHNVTDTCSKLIHTSIDSNNPHFSHLLEDALDLWQALLIHVTSVTPSVLSLLMPAIALLDIGSENLKVVLHILESYVRLIPGQILEICGDQLFRKLASLVPDLEAEASISISSLLGQILQACPASSWYPLLRSCGLLRIIGDVVSNMQTETLLLCSYLDLVARMCIADPMSSILNILTEPLREPPLKVWLEKFDNIGSSRLRKLHSLALSSLFSTNHLLVMEQLSSIINVWVDVLHELPEDDGGDSPAYWQDLVSGASADDPTPDDKRKVLIEKQDIVHTVPLRRLFKSVMDSSLQTRVDEHLQMALNNTDPLLLDQFKAALR